MTPEEWKGKLSAIKDSFSSLISEHKADYETLYQRFLGRKGELSLLLRDLKDIAAEERKNLGMLGNAAKQELSAAAEKIKSAIDAHKERSSAAPKIDITLPGVNFPKRSLHPLTQTIERISGAFLRLGFSLASGPLVEDDWHCFEALNFPECHPARDMQDTFYVNAKDEKGKDKLLRTQTSTVQIRVMEKQNPPLRVFHPGRTFRNEAVDASHAFAFHQVEGLYVDKNVSMADLKWTVDAFMKDLFGSSVKTRFNPSYFPFVEPGAEVDMSCIFCKGQSDHCPVCKGTGWLELLGSGMVHPNVLKACGHDPEVWSGFAFGCGIERVAMLLYGINDMRMFFENDFRLLEQVR